MMNETSSDPPNVHVIVILPPPAVTPYWLFVEYAVWSVSYPTVWLRAVGALAYPPPSTAQKNPPAGTLFMVNERFAVEVPVFVLLNKEAPVPVTTNTMILPALLPLLGIETLAVCGIGWFKYHISE
jgi:hypothetical protein